MSKTKRWVLRQKNGVGDDDGGGREDVTLLVSGWDGWRDGEGVGRRDPEAVVVGDVGHVLGKPGGVDVRVGAPHVAVGVAPLLLGGVGVGVAVSHVAELVLGVELQRGKIAL